ncbi:general transcription factor II-I repeat domain-containing protein 2-like [Tachypleus tridentatus]|uniref:general transcription factor II-I repeat domain-containing protein 2-like n=1 Tax=Tachypleus tridentatus TaxID=6853 RepID=UPI003FCF3825
MLDLVALKETTRGVDIKNALDRALTKADIPLDKLISVATAGVPTKVGKNAGLIVLMESDPSFPEFLPVHCIIRREHLAATYFKYEDVVKFVPEIVNFIRLNRKTHQQLKNFIE